MKSVILLRGRRVLWSAVMAACLLSGFMLTHKREQVTGNREQAQKAPNPESRIPNPGSAAHPRFEEAYGKLPLSFEVNKGQTDSTVKFLSRGSGYSLFLTGNEAVLALRKPGVRSQDSGFRRHKPGEPDFGAAHWGSADLAFRSAAFPGLLRSPELETDARTADPRTGSALQGLLGSAASFQFPVSNFQTPATNDEPRTTSALLRMKLVRANPNPKIVGTDELPGKSNYFIGNDPKKWRTNVTNYAKVKYGNVYPGVDLVYYGNQGQLEYDFVVQPGADPRQIALDVGAGLVPAQGGHPQGVPLRIGTDGDLVVGTDGGEVIFHKPVVYQPATYNELRTTNGGGRQLLEGQYVLRGYNRIAFQLADYDRRRPVVIDPVLAYSTYLGGDDIDLSSGIAVDASGNAYVTGLTDSTDFPVTPGAFQTTFAACYPYDCYAAFVSKLNAAGSALVYSTYLGGSSGGGGNGIAVDGSGNAYITGGTSSRDFPTTPGAFQTVCQAEGRQSVFVTKLNAAGSGLLYSTCLGWVSTGLGVAIDASGNAYVTGESQGDLPTTPGAFQTTFKGGSYYQTDAFVSKLNAAGSALVYSTYLGGTGDDNGSGIAVDASGSAYVTGRTDSYNFPITPGTFQTTCCGAFVTKLNPSGSALVYSTYLGGSGEDSGSGVAIDSGGSAYVTGWTSSSDFPTTPGAFQTTYGGRGLCGRAVPCGDAFVSKLNSTGSALVYSTYLGGSGNDNGSSIAVDTFGNAYVTGGAGSGFPTTPGAFQDPSNQGSFVTKLNGAGSGLVYSTSSIGGSGIALDAAGNAYLTGSTGSSNLPSTPGAFQTTFRGVNDLADAFVAKISFLNAPGIAWAPGSLTFGPQPVGIASAPQAVALLDAGSQPLSITSIVASSDFAQTNTCGSAVQPGAPCTLSVTFKPTAMGTRSGAITITDNAAGSPHQFLLTGTGSGQPELTLTPASLTFASQQVGTTSQAQPVTLTNTGSGPLAITSIAKTGDFAQTNNCGSAVSPGASCTLTVTFTPTAIGTRSGNVTITDDAAGSPQFVSLTGTGIRPLVRLAPASVAFLQLLRTVGTTSLPQTVNLTNVGSTELDISGITLAGPDSGDFAQSNNCSPTVAAGASCVIKVTFTPTAQGVRTASVSIADNAPGSPQTVPVKGRGTFLEWSPRYMNMGDEPVGTSSAPRTVTLTNAGSTAITLYSIEMAGVNPGDFTQTNTCGGSLNPGASCTIQVTFTPTAVGGRFGHVAISDSAFGGTHWVDLIGKGT
jgi:hypothetical protein